jgi:surface antigen
VALLAVMAALSVGLVLPAPVEATIGVDDYPRYLKNAAQDSLVDPWNFYNRECTSFVAWRLNHDVGIAFHNWYKGHHWGDAAIWKQAAVDSGVPVDGTPRVGAIAWWAKGSPGSSSGHVAWVIAVNSSSITVEEYNYLHRGGYDRRTISRTASYRPTAYIHLGDGTDVAMENTARPTVSGTPQVGVRLTASPGTWTPSGGTYSYQWYAGGSTITGATNRSFTPRAEQLGKQLRVKVTATKSGAKTGTAMSAATAATAPGVLTATDPPTISGTPQVGVQLSATAGAWSPRASYTYRWRDTDGPIRGATASTFTPTADQLDQPLRVTVTATRDGYRTARSTSVATTAVRSGTFAAQTPPTITGDAQVDETLVASPGAWSPGAPPAYQWLVDGHPVTGATGPTYAPTAEDVRKQVSVQVSVSLPGYTPASATSAATSAVIPGTFRSTSDPSVTGTPKVGVPLTADPGGWSPEPALTWQWTADGAPIPGATSGTFTPSPAEVGKHLTVEVTARRAGYLTAVTESSATAAVLPGANSVTQVPAISGLPYVGRSLTATPGTWAVTPTSVDYQWYAGGVAIAGATSSAFTPTEAQLEQRLTVRVTAHADGYQPLTASSSPTSPVLLGRAEFTTTPSLTGTALVGHTLTASPGTFTPAGATPRYQWLRGGVAISGATARTYTLQPADVGDRVAVRVTISAPQWAPTTAMASTTTRVKSVPQLSVRVAGHASWAGIWVRVVTPGLPEPDGRARLYEHGRRLGTIVVTDGRGYLRLDNLSTRTHHVVMRYSGPGPQAPASTRFDIPIG